MIDHGLKAAMMTAFRIFTYASRGTGRTNAMIRSARPGDLILCGSATEQKDVTRRLEEAGRKHIDVKFIHPNRNPLAHRGTNPRGATIFSHLYIEKFWEHRIEEIDRELRNAQMAMSKIDPPDEDVSGLVQRVYEADRHGLR